MINYKLDILDFVKTGNFSNIPFGISKNELISIGLQPDNWGGADASKETADFWQFGNIEFYFDKKNTLNSIFSDNLSFKLYGGKKIKVSNYWILNRRKITLQKTIIELLKLNLDFKKKFVNPGFIELILDNGVYFSFDFINDKDDLHCNWTMTAIGKRKEK